MEFSINNERDVLVMKLINYFITQKNYSPIIIHGVDNEIWLENPKEEYRIIRIVTRNIFNNEQYNYDVLRTKHILSQIKRRMLSLSVSTLSILTNVGENLDELNDNEKNYHTLVIENEDDVFNNELFDKYYSDIKNSMTFKEDGMELISKITNGISEKNIRESEKRNSMFKKETPIVTYILVFINILLFIITGLMSHNLSSIDSNTLYRFGGLTSNTTEYYRLITSAFLHVGFYHIFCNMYALLVVGPQVEQFFGRKNYILIYLLSAIMGSLFVVVFTKSNIVSVGASGAIFGLFGAIVYFGYNYRGYIGNLLLNQMIPAIAINLFISFLSPFISAPAHIGGLVGGYIVSLALGADLDEDRSQKISGMIVFIILTAFMIYMGFLR